MSKTLKGYDYVCAPFAGDIAGNVQRAILYAKYIYSRGGVPFVPHVSFVFLNEETQREAALSLCCRAVKRAAKLWVFAEGVDVATEGMAREILAAKECGIDIIVVDPRTLPADYQIKGVHNV